MKRLMKAGFVLLIALLLAGGELLAQTGSANDFTNNTGGTYKATQNLGKIVMRGQGGAVGSGVFRSDDNVSIGRDATNRIEGTVEWKRDGGTAQIIQGINGAGPGILYYTHLTYTGTSARTVEDNIWVFGTYNPNPSGTTGARTYNGTFHYDGDGTLANGVGAGFKATYQIIYPENQTTGSENKYNNLDIINGPKINNGDVICVGYITNSDGDNNLLTVASNFTVGTGASIVTGNMTISPDSNLVAAPASAYFKTTGAGTMMFGHASSNTTLQASPKGLLDIMSTGDFTVQQRGTLLLAEDGTNPGSLNVGYNATPVTAVLNFDGLFSNLHSTANTANRKNMTFAPASIVRYRETSGTPDVAGTSPTEYPAASGQYNYKYGNLELSGAVDKGVDGSVYMRGNFSLADANFIISTDNTLADATMLDRDVTGGKTATYDVTANAGRYVQGKMRITGTIPTASAVTMNNALTQVTFDATAGAPTSYFQLDVLPGDVSNYSNIKASKGSPDTWREKNLTRHVRMNWSGGTPKLTRLQVAFNPGTDEHASWNADATKIRFFEGYNATETQQKLLMMGHPATTNSDNVILQDSLVDLIAAGAAPGSPYQLADGSDIILGAPPILYITVKDGRWSNPVTWDEGVVPPYFADAEVRHLVYTGCDGSTFGMIYSTNDERDGQGAIPSPDINAAAKSITIVAKDDTKGWVHPALVIGNEPGSLVAGHVFRTQLSAPAVGELFGVYNLNDGGATTEYGPNLLRTVTGTDLDKLQGIYVMRQDGAGPIPIVGAGQIFNKGRIYNEGIIEVGR